jgi:hypothetical protein
MAIQDGGLIKAPLGGVAIGRIEARPPGQRLGVALPHRLRSALQQERPADDCNGS